MSYHRYAVRGRILKNLFMRLAWGKDGNPFQGSGYCIKIDVMTGNEILLELSPFIFWDVNIEKLDVKKNRDLIIKRIAVYGRDNDVKLMFKMYKKNEIKKILKNADCLNMSTVSYFGLILNIREKDFKCCKKKQPHLI